jgi:hypothetical protein
VRFDLVGDLLFRAGVVRFFFFTGEYQSILRRS